MSASTRGFSSSASASSAMILEEVDDLIGAESGWVEAKTSCDHLHTLSFDLYHIPHIDTPCNICQHTRENWICLICKDILCSRFVNKHMFNHYQETGHCLALSYSDLSVWCFNCDAYLDAEFITQLRPIHESAYLFKFGVRPPIRGTISQVREPDRS
ncbi:Ubiquitin carboxyl-terminal hydrolase [Zostera marina]|uniref:Ubiquitin carboxyl-terminal hydrolase n=1 Tax=Zostera marina TaxID=29655 RepID=A0A0K9PLH7_ZOSMR|nr:Ubiquitin carboxyl-terminal hydrolase [Zostera marina]